MSWVTFSLVGRVLTGTLMAAVVLNAHDATAASRVFAFSIVAALLAFLQRPSPLAARLEVVR